MTTEISPEMRMEIAKEDLRKAYNRFTFQIRNAEGCIKDALDAINEYEAAVKRAKELDV